MSSCKPSALLFTLGIVMALSNSADAGTPAVTTTRADIARVAQALKAQLSELSVRLNQLMPGGGGLTRSIGDFSPYVSTVRSVHLPQLQTRIDGALARVAQADATTAGQREALLRNAGVRLQAALLLTLALQMEVNVAVVAAYANEAGVPFGDVVGRLRDFDEEMAPLVQAAESQDVARMRGALTALGPRIGQIAEDLDQARKTIAAHSERTGRVIAIANLLTMALSLYHISRIPVVNPVGAQAPPAVGGFAGGGTAAMVASVVALDARALAELAQSVANLVAAGVLDPVLVGSLVGIGGGRGTAVELQKPQLLAMSGSDIKPESASVPGRNDRTQHGQERALQAQQGDPHRQVGDANRVIREGRRFRDTETGNTVYVNGDRVVITNQNGEIVTQFKNPRANTQARIRAGRWEPR